MQLKKLQNLYEKISPFFTLLYIYDIENMPIEQLALLHKNLELQVPIQSNLQSIYNRLEQASKRNVGDKLKKKRQKRQMQDKIQAVKQSQSKVLPLSAINRVEQSALDVSKINQSTMQQDIDLPSQFKQIQRKSGTIYNGELIVILSLCDLTKGKKIKVQFNIDSKIRQSCITKDTLSQLGLNSTNPSLFVDNRKQKFQISNRNRLGLSFLQKNNVILECNYRSEHSSFDLVYTQ